MILLPCPIFFHQNSFSNLCPFSLSFSPVKPALISFDLFVFCLSFFVGCWSYTGQSWFCLFLSVFVMSSIAIPPLFICPTSRSFIDHPHDHPPFIWSFTLFTAVNVCIWPPVRPLVHFLVDGCRFLSSCLFVPLLVPPAVCLSLYLSVPLLVRPASRPSHRLSFPLLVPPTDRPSHC